MKRICIILIMVFLLPFQVFSDKNCPYCHFKNGDDDRYCINCFKEIRSLTTQEKKALEEEDRKYEERKKKWSTQIKKEKMKSKKEKMKDGYVRSYPTMNTRALNWKEWEEYSEKVKKYEYGIKYEKSRHVITQNKQKVTELYFVLAGLHNEYGQYGGIIKAYEDLIAFDDKCSKAYFELITLYAQFGMRQKARDTYEKLNDFDRVTAKKLEYLF